MTHTEAISTLNIKVGDRLKVLKKLPGALLGLNCTWVDAMDKFVGKEGIVVHVGLTTGIVLKFDDAADDRPYYFPAQALGSFIPLFKPTPINKVISVKPKTKKR